MSARGRVPWLPSSLPLPYYARPDLAYFDDTFTGAVPVGAALAIFPSDGTLAIIPWISWTFKASAANVSRNPNMAFASREQSWVWNIPSAGTVGLSVTANVTAVAGVGSTFSTNNTHIIAIPLTWGAAGYDWVLGALNLQAGDQILGASWQAIIIPTGPELDAGPPPVVAVIPT